MTEWQKVKLGYICDVRDGTHDSPKQSLEGKFLVTSKHIKGGKIDLSSAYKISLEDFNFVNQRSKVEQWDILISMIGTLGEICLICTPPDFAIKNVGLIKAGNKDLAQYLFYYLKSPISQNDIETRLKGTTQQYLSLSEIRDFPVFLPPLEIQRKIAGILGALDDRIDVLRRENVVLEQMAQAVFQSWFVDFDIVRAKAAGTPESEVCEKYHISPELYALFPSALTPDNLPLGWEKKKLGDEFKIVMGQSPAGDTYNENRKGMPFFQGRRDFGFRYPTNRVYCTAPTRFAEKGDVLVSVRAPVGDLNIATEKCCIGRGVASVRHLSNSTAYAFCQLKTLSNQFDVFNGDGTVFGCIGKDAFLALPFVSAPREVLEKTLPYLDSFENKIFSNTQQIRALSATRNTLLPQLISGKLIF